MSKSDFQFSNQFVQLYCHGIQLRCSDLHEILKTANVDFKRRMNNPCFDLYEIKCVHQTIVSQFDHYHLMLFKDNPSVTALKSCADMLQQANTVLDVLNGLADFMRAAESPVQLRSEIKGDKAEISLVVNTKPTGMESEALQFLLLLRLFKIIRIVCHLANTPIPVYAIKVVGPFSQLAEPYIKWHRPEFIYHRQKRNAFVLPAKCLAVKCGGGKGDFSEFLRQHSDIFLSLSSKTEGADKHMPQQPLQNQAAQQQDDQNRLTFKEIKEKLINEKIINLLMDASLPASEIGRRLGISDASGLSRSFKEMNKVRPGEFCNGKMVRLN